MVLGVYTYLLLHHTSTFALDFKECQLLGSIVQYPHLVNPYSIEGHMLVEDATEKTHTRSKGCLPREDLILVGMYVVF